jgi:hypothetical protein
MVEVMVPTLTDTLEEVSEAGVLKLSEGDEVSEVAPKVADEVAMDAGRSEVGPI